MKKKYKPPIIGAFAYIYDGDPTACDQYLGVARANLNMMLRGIPAVKSKFLHFPDAQVWITTNPNRIQIVAGKIYLTYIDWKSPVDTSSIYTLGHRDRIILNNNKIDNSKFPVAIKTDFYAGGQHALYAGSAVSIPYWVFKNQADCISFDQVTMFYKGKAYPIPVTPSYGQILGMSRTPNEIYPCVELLSYPRSIQLFLWNKDTNTRQNLASYLETSSYNFFSSAMFDPTGFTCLVTRFYDWNSISTSPSESNIFLLTVNPITYAVQKIIVRTTAPIIPTEYVYIRVYSDADLISYVVTTYAGIDLSSPDYNTYPAPEPTIKMYASYEFGSLYKGVITSRTLSIATSMGFIKHICYVAKDFYLTCSIPLDLTPSSVQVTLEVVPIDFNGITSKVKPLIHLMTVQAGGGWLIQPRTLLPNVNYLNGLLICVSKKYIDSASATPPADYSLGETIIYNVYTGDIEVKNYSIRFDTSHALYPVAVTSL